LWGAFTAPLRFQIGRSRLANAPLRGRPMVQTTLVGARTNHIVSTVPYKLERPTCELAVRRDSREFSDFGMGSVHASTGSVPRGAPATVPVATTKVLHRLKSGFDPIGLAVRISHKWRRITHSRLPSSRSPVVVILCGAATLPRGGPLLFLRPLRVYPDAAVVLDG